MNKILLYIFRTLEYGPLSIKRGSQILFVFVVGVSPQNPPKFGKISQERQKMGRKGLIIPSKP
tara:strand:- start:583 stop:771 length:189 start_codon:yes stop_codon:yes gene_type:complete